MHINIGRPVAHNRFGVGFVTAIDGNKITVDFHADRTSRKILKSFLRAPTTGMLPYNPLPATDGAHTAMFFGQGYVPFTIVDAAVKQFVGATVAQYVIEDGHGNLAAVDFCIEHSDPAERQRESIRFSEFCNALGVLKPEQAEDFLGKRACIHALAGQPDNFARVAA